MGLTEVRNVPSGELEYAQYGAFKDAYAVRSHSRLRRVASALGLRHRYLRFLRPANRLLPLVEIGCGNGEFLSALMKDGFASVIGVEPSQSYRVVVDQALILRLYADAYLETCASESIGTVVALDVFEHIPQVNLKALLSLIHDRLVPGGILVFRVPNMASPLALTNYFGDLTHAVGLNEISIRQLLFGMGFSHPKVLAEPFAFPRSIRTIIGIALWPLFNVFWGTLLAAFGVQSRIMTPNLVCVVRKVEPSSVLKG